MGWSTGSILMSEIVEELKNSGLTVDDRLSVYEILINAFAQYDCDTLHECVGIDRAYDTAYKSIDDDYEEPDDVMDDALEDYGDYEDGT